MTLNHNWKKRSYSGPSNPRVVMGTPSYNGSHPTTARIRNTSANSFTVQLDEWDYLDGSHTNENISYLVAKNGSSRFGSLSVKSGEINLNHNWKTVNFGSSFSNKPVAVAQTVTRNGGAAVTTRIRNVTSTSFQVRLQEEEGADGVHATEKVHWIAIESGTTNSNGAKLVVGRTSNSVTDSWKSIGYSSVSSPKMIAAMQTFDGGDTAVLRRKNLTSSSVQVKVEEEQSDDSEVAHTTEVVGYIIMGR
ncbi:gp53-like domain-containing protein [Microbulbifer halophilus]